jgi:uncharacterized protein (TIGR00288 family)
MPEPRRMMIFADGENLVCRYQAMIKRGFVPQAHIYHEPDVYIWSSNIWLPGEHQIIRAYYYMSAVGDENKILSIVENIEKLEAKVLLLPNNRQYSHNLYPVVFKKPSKSTKVKVVDIQMIVDILSHVYQNNVDSVCLFSGDGDYKAVIDEVIRKGKQVYIARFSDGFSPILIQLVDQIIDLDPVFFDMNQSAARI